MENLFLTIFKHVHEVSETQQLRSECRRTKKSLERCGTHKSKNSWKRQFSLKRRSRILSDRRSEVASFTAWPWHCKCSFVQQGCPDRSENISNREITLFSIETIPNFFFSTPKIYIFSELKKKVGYSFDVKNCDLSIADVFRAIRALLLPERRL